LNCEIELKILDPRLGNEFPLPDYATSSSAGMDMRALCEQPITLQPGEAQLIQTGMAINNGDPNFSAVLLHLSGLAPKNDYHLRNLVGLIDADYQGPLMVSTWNRGVAAFTIQPGDRIAQLVLLPIARARFKQVHEFEQSARGDGGFGHTGVR